MPLKLNAAVPPNVTAVGHVKLVPVIVITVPLVPELELMEEIVGADPLSVKFDEDVAVLAPQV